MRLPPSGGAPIGVVQATRDRQHGYRLGMARQLLRWRLREALPAALVRPRAVAVRRVLAEHAGQLPRAEDEHVVEARATHAPEESCAHGMRLWRARRGPQERAATGRRDAGARRPALAIVVADRVARALAAGVASRSGWATQALVGWRVAPTWTTRRVASSTTKQAHSGRKSRSVTGRKSHAQLSGAWLRRKVAHVCPRGRGARWPRR